MVRQARIANVHDRRKRRSLDPRQRERGRYRATARTLALVTARLSWHLIVLVRCSVRCMLRQLAMLGREHLVSAMPSSGSRRIVHRTRMERRRVRREHGEPERQERGEETTERSADHVGDSGPCMNDKYPMFMRNVPFTYEGPGSRYQGPEKD
jgi:hypothetical protein